MWGIGNWLRNLANQLREALNLTPQPPSPQAERGENSPLTADGDGLQAYLQFLMEVLQATAESEGDAQVIYPLLVENTKYLNRNLAEVLRRWATSKLAEVETDEAPSIAGDIGNFSNLIQQFPLGDKASNMEIAIAGYEVVLTVFTRQAFPQQWASTQNNLATAYADRILGEKAQNIELAIASYTNALSVYTRDAFPQDWAMTQNNLGLAYADRILGEKAQNIELAIASYTNALSVYTREAFPQDWAMTQNNLAIAYRNRILGEKAQNIELAIASYTNALSVYTREAFPQQWAMTQNNLGNAYRNRILGEKAQNIELAIASYTNALSVRTRQAFPQQWAMTQNNLGNAYGDRILGEKAQNIELAIASYTNALSVRTRQAFPQQWAMTQNNLGAAYRNRILGEKAQNIEMAIASYTNALSVYTREAFPQDWAMTQNNLAAAYRNRILGEKAQNIEMAIASYTNALSVRTRQAFPQDWATTQNNLAIAYADRILGEKAQNIEMAIASYTNALSVRTRQAFPQDWATTQNNLATAYADRILGEKAQNIEMAIACYTNALSVYTRQAFPQDWAMTQNNLGLAYSDRILGEKAQNIEMAIASYTNALSVRTKDAFPQNHADTSFNLGIAYQDVQRFTDAYTTFKSAIETAELLRGEIVSGDESKRKQAEEWNSLYRRMVEVCLELKKYSEAIEYIERSKTRNLVELLFTPDLYPKLAISEELKNQFQQLQQNIEEEKRRVEQAEKSYLQDSDHALLNKLRQTREQLITKIIGLNPIRYDEIYNLLDKETAIIQFYIFGNCFRAFIITRHKEQPEIWQSEPQDLKKLQNWRDEYLQLYSDNKKHWRYCLNDKLSQLAEILHIQEILSVVPQECKKVILIPHRYLHLLPLHALPIQESCLLELFPQGVGYAPSCQLWRVTQNKAKTLSHTKLPHPALTGTPLLTKERGGGEVLNSHLFAIQNPTDNLEFTDIEVETIAAAFHPRQILKKSEATAQALTEPTTAEYFRDANWLHFSCHGYFNFNLPEKSALQLAASEISPLPADAEISRYLRVSEDAGIDLKKCLTLEDIFQLNLPNCRLVTLSACETGLVDGFNTSDEYIGLPSGFIRAGAASIVSSLWAVDDFSTALLMIKFYENLQTVTHNVPIALNSAQQWFRRVTQEELLQWIDTKTDMNAQQKQKVKERLKEYKPEHKPFEQAGFWAAFCAIGE
ncbi:TPR repeat-containing protein [Scytonema sp. HK-05]|nr:TPR repeat-containing protein [Scytonema sp. HK-05]